LMLLRAVAQKDKKRGRERKRRREFEKIIWFM